MRLKKGEIYNGIVEKIDFPNKGKVRAVENEDGIDHVTVKNALPGQTVEYRLTKKSHGRAEGLLKSVIEPAACEITDKCPNAGICGGCLYQGYPYEESLRIKEAQVKELLKGYIESPDIVYDGISASPLEQGYRNKMEYTFGDRYKDGPLALGLHKRGSFYDIVDADACRIADRDFGAILGYTRGFFAQRKIPYYHRMNHGGVLRHLLLRKASKTGEILAALVTSSESAGDGIWDEWKKGLLSLELSGHYAGILHIINDSEADAVKCDSMELLYGQDYFEEEILGLKFKITPFSFFQTNSLGAELLYEKARSYIKEHIGGGLVFDLYSGTGTIAQLLAPAAGKVVGVEIVEEAVIAAGENAKANGLSNCEFIAGDVLKVLDDFRDAKPDCIILDPPRDGINPKALGKILAYNVDNIVYISCKPTSLARDMAAISNAGYRIKRWGMVDMFPFTGNVETVVLLGNKFSKAKDYVEIGIDAEDYYRIKDSEKESK